jgi:hypothetical protein
MIHQFIYIVHEHTDEFGWQYRHQWPHSVPGPKEEPWSNKQNSSSRVRRRIWMTTVVPRQDLVRAKRYLAENLRIDNGIIKKQGELLRYEKGTLTKTWNKRKVVLYHNRLEFYSGNQKKGEILLNEVEIKMLFDTQCQGRKYAFSIRNATGSVGVLLDAEDEWNRRSWVMAISYQLAITSFEMNFPPLEVAPPTGEYPDNRVLISGDLMLQGSDGTWYPRHFQLLPRELVYYQDITLKGRIFIEQAKIISEERLLTFSITSISGITFNCIAGNAEAKNVWISGISKQLQSIENQKLKAKTIPKEEQYDDISPSDRLLQLREGHWIAPTVDGESTEYMKHLFSYLDHNNPDIYEFSEELGILSAEVKAKIQKLANANNSLLSSAGFDMISSSENINANAALSSNGENNANNLIIATSGTSSSNLLRSTASFHMASPLSASSMVSESPSSIDRQSLRYSQILNGKSFLFSTESKLLDPKRNLINPRFMLASLKGVTHRFVLVLESEMKETAKREIKVLAPPRFTVGGPRASKDPRTVNLNQLIGVSNSLPEIQLPAGWFMLHQYMYIVQQNTDDFGWQYRSNWSDGALRSSDEQWVDTFDDNKYVRRRLWMTTVVKRDDIITGKKMVYEELNKNKGEAIYQEFLLFYHPGPNENDPDWHRRKVILYHDKMEFFAENNKIGEATLHDCEVQILLNDDTMGKDNAFRIRHPNGAVDVILAADTRSIMLRWVKALKYQFAIITPDVNFEPFFYGPPTGELSETRVILCGELEISDSPTSNPTAKWEPYQLVLQERILLCYSRDNLAGRFLLEGAFVKSEEENEFYLKLSNGLMIRLRADTADMKVSWVRGLKRQIQFIEYKKGGFLPVSDDSLTMKDIFQLYKDPDWSAQEINYVEDEIHMNTIRYSYNSKLTQFWNGSATSPFASTAGGNTNSYVPTSHALPGSKPSQPVVNITSSTDKSTVSQGPNIGVNNGNLASYLEQHKENDTEADWADYSVYNNKEIAERRQGYVPTPNLSEISGISKGRSVAETTPNQSSIHSSSTHNPNSNLSHSKSPLPIVPPDLPKSPPTSSSTLKKKSIADVDIMMTSSFHQEEKNISDSELNYFSSPSPPLREGDFSVEVSNRSTPASSIASSCNGLKMSRPKSPPSELLIPSEDTNDDDIEFVIRVPKESTTSPVASKQQQSTIASSTSASSALTSSLVLMDSQQQQQQQQEEEEEDYVIQKVEVVEEITTIQEVLVETIIGEDGHVEERIISTTEKSLPPVVVSSTVTETHYHGTGEPYPELNKTVTTTTNLSSASATSSSTLSPVALKHTSPRTAEMRRNSGDLYANELFQKQAQQEAGADSEYDEGGGRGSYRSDRESSAESNFENEVNQQQQGSSLRNSFHGETEKEDSDDEPKNRRYHQEGRGGNHSHIITIRDGNSQSVGASNDLGDLALFSSSIDHEEFYNRWHKSMELDRDKDYQIDPDSLTKSQLLGLFNKQAVGGDERPDSDKMKRNTLEEYLKAQMSADEYESFMITAKNLRHVDEEDIMKNRQKYHHTGDEDDNEAIKTIYDAVKLRPVPKTENSSDKQKDNETSMPPILAQVKLRSVPSKIKSEIASFVAEEDTGNYSTYNVARGYNPHDSTSSCGSIVSSFLEVEGGGIIGDLENSNKDGTSNLTLENLNSYNNSARNSNSSLSPLVVVTSPSAITSPVVPSPSSSSHQIESEIVVKPPSIKDRIQMFDKKPSQPTTPQRAKTPEAARRGTSSNNLIKNIHSNMQQQQQSSTTSTSTLVTSSHSYSFSSSPSSSNKK